jgi:hypothetical protein
MVVAKGKEHEHGHGVFVHRFKCIYYEKSILNIFQNIKKEIWMYIRTCYIRTQKFVGKDFCVGCVKRQIKIVKTYFEAPIIVFFTRVT